MCCNKPAWFALSLLLALAGVVSADDRVWSAVVLASTVPKGEQPKPAPAELAPFAPRLAKIFGYSQFEVVGSATKLMDGQTERWLVPTQNFWVGAKATRKADGYLLDLEFFHDKRRILETQVTLGPGSPLFVRGPMHARGQLIVVFEIKR
jgi:hypothetical protein